MFHNKLCQCCDVIEYENEETLNFYKELSNQELTNNFHTLTNDITNMKKYIIELGYNNEYLLNEINILKKNIINKKMKNNF